MRPTHRRRVPRGLLGLCAALLYVWSLHYTEISPGALVQGVPFLFNLVGRMLPPDWTVFPELLGPTLETVAIGVWGTTLAVLIGLPLAVLAAANTTPARPVREAGRAILNFLRAIPELVFALIFVSAVGLGPFPGVLALAFHSAGQLGKLYADSIEAIGRGPYEALVSTGAVRLHVVRFAVIPQILPELVSFTLFRWEANVREAFVLGVVGAGGLGFELQRSLRLFEYARTSSVIVLILVTVTLIEGAAGFIRSRVI